MENNVKRCISGRPTVAKLNINNKIYNIYDGVNTIGRNREAIVNIKHLNVSQNHAIIIALNGDHFISDLKSSNNTYCNNRKIYPFKLERLEHNTIIKLGDVLGTYIIQGLDEIQSQSYSQSTQELTQSIYGSTTQLLVNSNNTNYLEDMHEAPTQAIIFNDFKVPKSVQPEDDIHDAETQAIDIQKVNRDVSVLQNGNTGSDNTIHGTEDICVKESNDASSTSNISKLATSVDVLEDVYDDCLPYLEHCNDNNKALNDNDEEVTDCEDNIPRNVCSLANQISSHLGDNNSNDSTEFFKVTDDNMNAENNIVESDPSVSKKHEINLNEINKDTKTCPNNNCEDSTQFISNDSRLNKDEETDCEENTASNIELAAPFGFQNVPVDDPDSNDSSDFFKLNNLAEESSCSLKSQNSIIKEASNTQDSSDFITFKKKKVCQLSSDSETEDDLKVVRKRKSALVLCTQDLETDASQPNKPICGNANDDEDSYIITETDSDAEMDVSNMKTLEKSIPATQNQSAADLNDTDCIPATQDMRQLLVSKVKNKSSSQVNSESSESFKFGLTQMLTEESQLSNKNINCIENSDGKNEITIDNIAANTSSTIISENDPSHKKCFSSKQLDVSADNINSSDNTKNIPDDTLADVELYCPTQKICFSPKQINVSATVTKLSNRTLGISDDTVTDTELYGPTQKICLSTKQLNLSTMDKKPSDRTLGISDDPDTELYGPTQKICSSPKQLNISEIDTKPSNRTLGIPDDPVTDSELYGPTQKICLSSTQLNVSALEKNPNKNLGITDHLITDTELYGPTQKICFSPKQLNSSSIDKKPFNRTSGITADAVNDCDLYGPTQKICMSPKQLNMSATDRKPSNITLGIDNEYLIDTDMYGPTQKICPSPTHLNTTVDRKPSNKTLSVVNLITETEFNDPTQKICLSPKPFNVSVTDRKPSKKSLGMTNDGDNSDLDTPTEKISIKLSESMTKKPTSDLHQNKILDNTELYLGSTQPIMNANPLKLNEDYGLNKQDICIKTNTTSNTRNENANHAAVKLSNSRVEDDIFEVPTQVIPVFTEIPKVPKFSFKKMEYNLDKSLSTLLKDDSIVEPVKESIDINFDNIEIEPTGNRPSNPVSNLLDQSKETEDIEFTNVENILEKRNSAKINLNKNLQGKSENLEVVLDRNSSENQESGIITEKKRRTKISEENFISSRKSLVRDRRKKITSPDNLIDHGKLQLDKPDGVNVQGEGSLLRKSGRRNPRKTYVEKLNLEDTSITNNAETKQRRSVKQNISRGGIYDEKPVISEGNGENMSEKVGKEKGSGNLKKLSEYDDNSNVTKSNICETRKRFLSTDSNQSSDMNINTKPKRENKRTKASLVVEEMPKRTARNSKRKLLSSDELNNLTVSENKLEEKDNVTTVEVNQSIALLESKITKTKRVAKKIVVIDDLDLKVPRNRRSMAVVEQNETLEQPNSSRISVATQKVKKKQSISKEIKKKDSEQAGRNTVSTVKILKPSKRKNILDSTASESNDGSCIATAPSTPKKQKLTIDESVLLSSTERAARRQKPKVVFTMMDSPQMETFIRQLGGSIIDSVSSCTVLVTEHVKRSQKLLCAVGLGKPICSPQWIVESKKSHEFLDPWDYILQDPEAEAKWNFTLKESLTKSKDKKLLENYQFLIQVTTAVDVLKGAIEACGGKCITKIPKTSSSNTFIISSMDNQNKYKRILKQHPNIKVINAEAIFDGVLRQELRFSNHFLN